MVLQSANCFARELRPVLLDALGVCDWLAEGDELNERVWLGVALWLGVKVEEAVAVSRTPTGFEFVIGLTSWFRSTTTSAMLLTPGKLKHWVTVSGLQTMTGSTLRSWNSTKSGKLTRRGSRLDLR